MSGNLNSDVKTSTTIEGSSSPELLSIFQDGDKRKGSEAVSKSQDKENSGETEVVSTCQDLKEKEVPDTVDSSQDICKFVETKEVSTFKDLDIKEPKVVDASIDTENLVETEEVGTFQDLEKIESKTVDTSEDIKKRVETEGNSACQGREKIGETGVFSTHQDLDIVEAKVVDSSQNVKKLVETEEFSTCQDWEKIRETEVSSTSQDLEKKGESEAICTFQKIDNIAEKEAESILEASEDSFSEGSIHIRVSEPFSLTEDLESYLSEGNSDDGTENVVECLSELPLQDQNDKFWSKQEEIINGEVNPTISQGTPVAKTKNSDKAEKLFSSIKPCSVNFINTGTESKGKSPSNSDQVADTEKHFYTHQPKRRGRPPKSVKKTSIKPYSVNFINTCTESKGKSPSNSDQVTDTEKHFYTHQPKRRGRPPKSVIKIHSAGSDDWSNKKVKQRRLKEIEQPVNINLGEITKTEIMSINPFDKTVLDERIKPENLSAKEPTSSTGHAFKRNTVNILTPKDLINQTLAKLMSGNIPRSQKKALDEGKKEVISDTLIVSSIDTSEKLDISEQSISDNSNTNMNSRPKRGFKSIMGLGEPSTKSHTTEIKPLPARELFTDKGSENKNNSEQTNTCISVNSSPNEDCKIQPNLGKSTNKSHSVTMITPRELINRTLEKLTCKKISQANQKPSVKEENSKSGDLSSEQLIEKRKKEEMQRELINRTLTKLTNGALPKSKQEKSDEIKTNDSSARQCITKNEGEKVTKKKPATLRALIPRESKSKAKIFIPLKLKGNSKGRVASSSSSECKQQESLKASSSHKDHFETTKLLQNESCKKNIPLDEPSSKICSSLKIGTLTDPNLKNKKTIRPKQTSEIKDEFCSTSNVVSPSEQNHEKASQKTSVKREKLCIKNQDHILFESPVLHNVKWNKLGEKNKSCPTLNSLTQDPELMSEKRPKSKQVNPKEKVFRKNTRFASNIRRKTQLPKTVLSKKYKLKSKKELVIPLSKKCKQKVQMDRQTSLSLKMTVANKESISMIGKNSKTDEITPVEQQDKCSSSSLKPSTDQVPNPRVCLVDCKKIGLCASNENVSKFKIQAENDLTLKQITCTPNCTDNHMIVDSGEYFTQLELSPSSKSSKLSNLPFKSLPTPPNKKMSTVDKGSQINEIIIIDDDDDDYYLSELRSISASLPADDNDDDYFLSELCSTSAHKLKGSKQCSVSSSQKSVSMDDFATKKRPVDHVPNKIDRNSAPREQSSSVKMIEHAYSLSTQVQKDSINYASQSQSPSVTQPQSLIETRNYLTQDSVRKDSNLISTKVKEGTRDMPQNKQSISTFSTTIMEHSSSNNMDKGPTPHSALVKKDIPPLMPTEMLTPSTWNKEMKSNSSRKSRDQFLKILPKIPISAPLLPNKNLPVASGSKNYYFTPLFVLDGEKVVPLNVSNASNYTVGNYNTPNSHLKSGHNYCKSTIVTKMSHTQMIIDSKTIKPLPTLDLLAITGSSVVSPSVASPKLDVLSTNQSVSVIDQKTKGRSGSFKVSSTQPNNTNLEPSTKRKRVGLDGAGTRTHCSSSTYSDIESDHLTAPKRIKYQSPPVTKSYHADHGSSKMPEPRTKQKNYSGREKSSNECEHHEEASFSSTNPSIECDKPTSPKRIKYQEHHKTSYIPLQPSKNMPDVSSINCNEPYPNNVNLDRFSGNNEMTITEVMSKSMSQNQEKQLNCPKGFNKQLKGKGGNLSTLSRITNETKKNMSVGAPKRDDNKPSSSPKQENKQVNSKKNSQQNKNTQVKSGTEENVDKHSDSPKEENKQENSKMLDSRRKVKKRIKSKEEDLEECLDGVPPFIQEVFECENIRDGFDNRDLIFVLSLLPDLEEMTSAQRVIFQSRVIQIINDVFTNTKPQSVIQSVKT